LTLSSTAAARRLTAEAALRNRPATVSDPMTLANAAAPHLDCHHQVEPDPAEMAARYGAEMTVPDWHKRLVCGRCGSRRVDFVVTGERRSPL
jgi:hypothetical protein